ncbi:hypothetical protein [uncultured Caulobacter sp.]|uniref:DUF7684 family protein n=1 Tax=uncultured Caulobacter sp. TaxID=158749 RepID=UPI002632CCC4|nr:hypothetical protein [uncultured Caulobacter sp.]
MAVSYLHLPHGHSPPKIKTKRPYRAVVVLEQVTSPEWRDQISAWLVESGCLFMMAWGPGSSDWDDSVDLANLAAFDGTDIPDDHFVMTTWHDAEPLSETLWFAEHAAHHPTIQIGETMILDVAPRDREAALLEMVRLARERTV